MVGWVAQVEKAQAPQAEKAQASQAEKAQAPLRRQGRGRKVQAEKAQGQARELE